LYSSMPDSDLTAGVLDPGVQGADVSEVVAGATPHPRARLVIGSGRVRHRGGPAGA